MGHYWNQTKETAADFLPELRDRTVPAVSRGIERTVKGIASLGMFALDATLTAWVGPVDDATEKNTFQDVDHV